MSSDTSEKEDRTASGNVTILIFFWVLARWEGTRRLISIVFNLVPALGTSGFGADTGVPACRTVEQWLQQGARTQAPSAPLRDVCPDVKVSRGTAGMFDQELSAHLGSYRLGL